MEIRPLYSVFLDFSMKGRSMLEDAVTHSDAGRRPSIDATRRLQQLSVKTSLSLCLSVYPSTPTNYVHQNTTFRQHEIFRPFILVQLL
jgi:hypothetical protein